MKKTLDYKILKHLSENDNGEYLNISFLSDSPKLLRQKLNELERLEFISIQLSVDPNLVFEDFHEFTFEAPCKIKIKGIEFLKNLNDKSNSYLFKIISVFLTIFLVVFAGWSIYLKPNQSKILKENVVLSKNLDSILKRNSRLKEENNYLLKLVDSLKISNSTKLK